MQAWHGLVIGGALAVLAFQAGYSRGAADCPELARMQAQREAAIDRDLAWAMEQPTGREAACDQVFDIVQDELRRDVTDEQEYRDARP